MIAPNQINLVVGRSKALPAQPKLPYKNVLEGIDVSILVEIANNNQCVAWGGVSFDHGLRILGMTIGVLPLVVPVRIDKENSLS